MHHKHIRAKYHTTNIQRSYCGEKGSNLRNCKSKHLFCLVNHHLNSATTRNRIIVKPQIQVDLSSLPEETKMVFCQHSLLVLSKELTFPKMPLDFPFFSNNILVPHVDHSISNYFRASQGFLLMPF